MSSKCKLARHKDGTLCAIKLMKRDVTVAGEEKNLELWKKEVKVMVDLDHPRIVKLRDFDSQAFMEKFSGKKVPVVFLAL